MNIRPSDETLVVHFSRAKVDRVDELDPGLLVAFDVDRKIVDITVRAGAKASRLDLVEAIVFSGKAKVTYDAVVDAVWIRASNSAYRDSEEVLPGFVVDYDTDGFVRGFEFLNASDLFSDQTMVDIRKCATPL